MAVCIVCGGSGFSLHDGLCDECNGTGENNFDFDIIIPEDESEDTIPAEPLNQQRWQEQP